MVTSSEERFVNRFYPLLEEEDLERFSAEDLAKELDLKHMSISKNLHHVYKNYDSPLAKERRNGKSEYIVTDREELEEFKHQLEDDPEELAPSETEVDYEELLEDVGNEYIGEVGENDLQIYMANWIDERKNYNLEFILHTVGKITEKIREEDSVHFSEDKTYSFDEI